MIIQNPLLILNTSKDTEDIKNIILKYFPKALTEENPDSIFSVGGDGTILHTVKNEGHRNIPIFGIAKGTLNFIPSHEDNWDEFFKNLFLQKIQLDMEKTFYIDISIVRENGEIEHHKAVNDIVLGGGIMDYFHFNLNSEDSTFSNREVSAGGLCIASPLGSTAYHYNNKGTIIPSLNLPLLAITTIVANRKDSINKMISSSQNIEISLSDLKENRDDCYVFIDGKTTVLKLNKGDRLILSEGSVINFLFSDLKKFEMKRLTF